MPDLPSLDAHAHFDPSRSSLERSEAGAVLAMTLSLDKADKMVHREEPLIAWGVGCHPRKLAAQKAFDPDRFAKLAGKSAINGEVGLDVAYQVPIERQLTTRRSVLLYTAKNPGIISLHSFQSTSLMLTELRLNPVAAPILHWLTGTAPETRQAVELGCYFSFPPRSPGT